MDALESYSPDVIHAAFQNHLINEPRIRPNIGFIVANIRNPDRVVKEEKTENTIRYMKISAAARL